MRVITSSITLIVLILVSVVMAAPADKAEAAEKAILDGNNIFTSKLYAELSKEKGKNIFFSPLSVHTILSLLYQGANAESENALRTVLNLPDKETTAAGYERVMNSLKSAKGVTLDIANKVYVMDKFTMKPAFKQVATTKFNSEAENVNFGDNVNAAKKINTWVESKTNNRIKDLISPDVLDANTRMALINAIYFKGDWKHKFNKDATTKEKFYETKTKTVDVDMMHISEHYNYKEDDKLDAKVLEMPYVNDELSMVFVLPNDVEGMDKLENSLKSYDLSKLTDGMRNIKVDVSLPKFKIESTMQLGDTLKQLGLENLFSSKANLSGLIESDEDLYVSSAIQKAFVEVNEEGAEAAAATGIIVSRITAYIPQEPPVIFRVDHPFLMLLVRKSFTFELTIVLI